MIDLDELEKLAEAATPGTWDAVLHAHGTGVENDDEQLFIEQYGLTYAANPSDALFIAAANPQAVLELVERVWQAEARIAEAAKLHRNAGPSQGYDSRFRGGYGMLGDCCATCGSHGEYGVEWPCPTAVALGLNEGDTDD